MNKIIEQVRTELIENADEKTRVSGLRFFKEEVKIYGLKSAHVSTIAKQNFQKIKNLSKQEIFELCEELWQSGYMEESFIACNWSYAMQKQFQESDFEIFENWVGNYIANWASCDTFCNHTVGEFIEKFPAFIERLKKWTRSENRWMRRASAVSLIIPARKGKFLNDIFEIAGILLPDKEDMVQKGYGWMLKEASKPYQKEVFEFVVKNKAVMPRTALRYAIEKMPEELRKKAMEK
ncbi:MAG: DNA alkylation repair protein [Bacteroidales bacterium]